MNNQANSRKRQRGARPGFWPAASLSLAGLLIAFSGVGCSVARSSGTESSGASRIGPPALTLGESSAEAAARRALLYIANTDKTALRSLRVTEQEFCDWVWPELPSSNIPNVSCGWAWEQATLKSDAGFNEMWAEHAGKHYRFVSLRFAGGSTSYRSFIVHNDARVTVKDVADAQIEVKLFGSVLEMSGQFKFFSFVVD